jgi:hypothetical protein
MNPPEWLAVLGIPEGCISSQSSATERGLSFTIHRQEGDQIWRVRVDDCWLKSGDEKKVDYLFWGQSTSGRKVILLVELKGQNFGKALEQIESTRQHLCKRADHGGVHTGLHQASPGHDLPVADGVRAYVVLSKGRGVPQRQRERERIRKRYGVLVRPKSRRLEINGIEALP